MSQPWEVDNQKHQKRCSIRKKSKDIIKIVVIAAPMVFCIYSSFLYNIFVKNSEMPYNKIN